MKLLSEKCFDTFRFNVYELADQIKHMVFLIDLEGKILYANMTSAILTGYNQEEFQQKKLEEILCNKLEENLFQQLWNSRAIFEKQKNFDNEILCNNHLRIPVELSFHSVDFFKLPLIMVIASDAREKRTIQSVHQMIENYKTEILEMNTENEVYALVVDRIKEIIGEGIVFTAISDESISTFELNAYSKILPQVNSLASILGKRPKEISVNYQDIPSRMISIYQSGKLTPIKKGLFDITACQIPQSKCSMAESLLNVNFTYSVGFYHEGNLYGWLSILRFEPLDGFSAYIEDMVKHATFVIDAIRKKKALNESERSLASLINHLPGFAYRCLNNKQWTMIYLSDAFTDVTGYAPQSLINNKDLAFVDLIDEDYREKIWQSWQDCLIRKKKFKGEYPLKTKKGETRWVREQGSGVYTDDGDLKFIEGFITDITDQKHIIESKEQFINLVSHELKTPMTAMHGGIKMILRSHADQCCEEALHILKIVNNNIQRLSTFANDVLDFQKISSDHFNFNFQLENLENIVDEALETMKLLCTNPEVQLIKQIDKNLPSVLVDKDKMLHVLTNLISNGIKNTEKGYVKVEAMQNATQDQVHIKIVDTGTGIKKEDLGKLFTKYFQIKNYKNNYQHGTGLGLVIAKEIMHQHGGELRAESYWGEGTTMHMILPLKKTPSLHTA